MLKDRAIAAHKEQQEFVAEEEAARFATRFKATEAAFQKMFGENLFAISPGTCDIVLAKDGLKLRAVFNDRRGTVVHFELAGACPKCGAACYSRAIYSLGDLGKQIAEFVPRHGHKCAPAIHHPTAGEALLEALQGYIEEVAE